MAIVGGGFTGLSAALALARRGASVVVLEAGDRVAAEASGRNGGHVNNGLAVDYAEVAAKVGVERARAWYRAYDDAVDTVERLVRDEAIDCDFVRHGKLKLATRPGAARRAAAQRRAAGAPTASTPTSRSSTRARVRAEVAERALPRRPALQAQRPDAHGPLRARPGAGGRAPRRADPHRHAACSALERLGSGHAHRAAHRARHACSAQQVLLATGATRHGGYGSFGWLRRRIVPIGSFIVVTEPLGAERARALLRERRTYVTVANIHHYFRLTADHRLVFGGRARFAVSSPQSDAKSGEILRAGMAETFPQLARRAASTTAGAGWST